MSEQYDNLARVQDNIGATVIDFLRRVGIGGEFHAATLRFYVAEQHMTAPGSPDRILRALRQAGIVGYEVLSRSKSLYRVTAI